MNHKRLIVALLFSAWGLDAAAADKPVAARTVAVAGQRFDVGNVLVERHGTHGRPLILIPGLASGAWVWDDTVQRYAKDHQVYVLTLPGFDGRPAVEGPQLTLAQAALLDLITSRKLDKPVLIGHSLGGTLALAFAEQHSDLIAGVVSVDGLPVFPGTENIPPALRPQVLATAQNRLAGVTPEAFAAQQRNYMRTVGVLDTTLADSLAADSAKSDPATTGAWVGEVMALDLRGELAAIKVPVLYISPYFDGDSEPVQITEEGKKQYAASLLAGTAQLDVVSISPARHFVMFDAPDDFSDAITAFLGKLK